MIELIKKIKELEKTAGEPFNGIKLKKARQDLTKVLLVAGKEYMEVEDYVLQIGYTKKDKTRPYTMIFTKQSFENHKNYATNFN